MLAAIWANYTPEQFFELEGEAQSLIVAAYRTNNQVEAVVTSEQIKEQKRKAAKSKGKR
jgi:hypothetical protein